MKTNIELILNDLEKIKNNNYLVIVEGKKDKRALNGLGITKVIFLENKPLFKIVEDIDEKEVVILTDLDAEGRKLFNKLRYQLQRRGIKLHNKIREDLFKSKLRHIEGLATYLNKRYLL